MVKIAKTNCAAGARNRLLIQKLDDFGKYFFIFVD